jgi:Transglutaminase-like superfamily
MFGNIAPGWGRVQAICDFVHSHIRFDYRQARSTRTVETFNERVGVCRDFAHLTFTLCRCLNIPARYVNGHLGDIGVPVVDPMDFSAWIEVFWTGDGTPSIRATTFRASHRSGTRPRCRRHSVDQLIWAASAEIVPRLDLRGHGYSATCGPTRLAGFPRQSPLN